MAYLDFGPANRPVDAIFLHANGFNARAYRTILAPLGSDLRILAADHRGHGATTLPTLIEGRADWHDVASDLLAFMAALRIGQVVLAGHSMGATAALLAAADAPAVARQLVFFDPVIRPLEPRPAPQAGSARESSIVQGASRRRSHFPSRQAVLESYRGRGAFSTWTDAMLEDYVAAGFRDLPDGSVEIACAPEWEASNYVSQGHDSWAALEQTRCPIRIFKAEQSSAAFLDGREAQLGATGRIRVETVPGTTHFLPMERPELVRAAIREAVAAGPAGMAHVTLDASAEGGEMAAVTPGPRRVLVARHSGVVRLTHWINAVSLFFLLLSGLQIFNAHPALYWGAGSDFAHPWLAMGAQSSGGRLHGVTIVGGAHFDTTGFLGVSKQGSVDVARGFPTWLTIPAERYLALGRRWHFFFAWAFAINGLIYLATALIGGHLRKDVWPTREQLRPRHVLHEIWTHLQLKFPKGEEARRYNILQKGAYLAVVLILLPLMALTGMTMSPSLDATFPWLLDIFGGRQSARSIHFITANLIVLFFLVHIFMVIVSGLWNNIRSMITGRYAIELAPGETP
jgi:thiosulfate reductase cytochrome b subunit/pimeloyl-ACP methyl ester carboxylesterase